MRLHIGIFFLTLLCILQPIYGITISMQELSRDLTTSGAAGIVTLAAGGKVCLLNGEFNTPGPSRACWDLPLRQKDLSAIAGIKLRLRCLNAGLASHATIHVQCENAWFTAPLAPAGNAAWEEIFIPKSSLMPEGRQCASWKKAKCLRISVWKGAEGRFQWQLSHVEFVPADSGVALLRTGTAAGTAEGKRKSALGYCKTMGEALTSGGARPAVIDEADASPSHLKKFRCIIVPATGDSSPATTEALASYLRGGGRAMVFHDVPRAVAGIMGLPPAKFRRASTLPRPLAAVITPFGTTFTQSSAAFMEVNTISPPLQVRAHWLDTGNQRTRYPAIIQSPRGMWMTHVYLNQNPERGVPLLVNLLNDLAPGFRDAATRQVMESLRFAVANTPGFRNNAKLQIAMNTAGIRAGSNDYPGVLNAAQNIRNLIADAAMPQNHIAARQNEIRGAWMRSPNGLAGKNWDAAMVMLARDGYNTVFPLMATPLKADHANLKTAVAAAKRNNLAIHPWVMVLNLDGVPENLRASCAEKNLLQVNYNGTMTPWLCPGNPVNRKNLASMLQDMVRKHAVNGIHLDMIRYESSSYCYCFHCKNAFRKYLGRTPQEWPECTLAGGRERRSWLEFRRHQITTLVQELANAVRAARPGCTVSAAVFPEPSIAADSVAQNWQAWLNAKLVDFAAPMTYRPSASLFQNDLQRICRTIGAQNANRLLPGIGATTEKLSSADTSRQIQSARALNTAGFIIFEYTAATAGRNVK